MHSVVALHVSTMRLFSSPTRVTMKIHLPTVTDLGFADGVVEQKRWATAASLAQSVTDVPGHSSLRRLGFLGGRGAREMLWLLFLGAGVAGRTRPAEGGEDAERAADKEKPPPSKSIAYPAGCVTIRPESLPAV